MQKKWKYRFLAAGMSCSLLFSGITAYADTSSGEINAGEDIGLVSGGASGSTNNSGSDHESSSSNGSSYQATQAELNAHREQQVVRGMLQDYMGESQGNSRDQAYGIGSNSGELISIGFVAIKDSQLAELLAHVEEFSNNLGKGDNADDFYNNQKENNGKLPHKTLPTDASVQSLSADEKKKAKEAIAEKEGLKINKALSFLQNLTGYNHIKYQTTYRNDRKPFLYNGYYLPQYQNAYGGIRNDLWSTGMKDSYTWNGRFHGLERFTSNQMEDYANLANIEDYHIQSVEKDHIEVIDYTSDVRRWSVYRKGEEKSGQPIRTAVTDNPRHEFRFSSDEAGTYTVVAEQQAHYKKGLYVKYDICDYFLDVETGNLLYFNEKLVSNGQGGSVLVGMTEEDGYVPTGDQFEIKVNPLGEVETDGAATQRVR